jgi:hypothetical protein
MNAIKALQARVDNHGAVLRNLAELVWRLSVPAGANTRALDTVSTWLGATAMPAH